MKLGSTRNLPSPVRSHDFAVFHLFVYSLAQSLSDGNQAQAFPPRQGSSAVRFLVSFVMQEMWA